MQGKQLNKFWALPRATKLAYCEAVLLLTVAQVLIKALPYAWWSRSLGPVVRSPPRSNFLAAPQTACAVGAAVETVARNLPWDVVCLPRAMAAKWMLERRRIPSTLFVGSRTLRGATSNRLALHAWLEAGSTMVTGGEIANDFHIVAQYGPSKRLLNSPQDDF